MSSKKCLIIEEVNSISLLIGLGLKLFGWTVYYFETVKKLSPIGSKYFIPLSLESIERPFEKGFSLKTKWLEQAKSHFEHARILPELLKTWSLEKDSYNKVLASFSGYFLNSILTKVYPHVFADEFSSRYSKVWLLDTKGPYSLYKIGEASKTNYRSFYCPNFSSVKKIFNKFTHHIKRKFGSKKEFQTDQPLKEPQAKTDGKVLFFPHKGIFYGELFLKDHYFFDHIEGLSHKEMSFVAYGDRPAESDKSRMWLSQQDIGILDLHKQFPGRLEELKSGLKLFKKMSLGSTYESVIDFITIKFFIQTENYRRSLKVFSKAKVAVFGFDILVPRTLTLALFLENIRTLATQERLFPAFMRSHPLVLDTYLTISPLATEEMKRHPDFYAIDKIKSAGPIRMNKYPSDFIDHKYSTLSKGRKIILVLPFYCSLTAEENRFNSTNSWKTNHFFYERIIELAKMFPDLFFVIKEKEVTLTKVKIMNSVVEDIEATENLYYESDLVEYSPFKISAICSGCIAMNTSLGDELLYLGKPVIFFDFGYSIPLPYFSYGQCDIMAETFEELVDKTNRYFLKGETISNLDTLYSSNDKSYANKILASELQTLMQ